MADNEERLEKKTWFWRGYCVVMLLICVVFAMMLPDLSKRIANQKDVLYGIGSAENALTRVSAGADAELYSPTEQLAELKEECRELERQAAGNAEGVEQ